MLWKFQNLISKFDLFSYDFHLRINGQSKYKSLEGGALSLFTLSLLIIIINVVISDFYQRNDCVTSVNSYKYSTYMKDIGINNINLGEDNTNPIILKFPKVFYRNGYLPIFLPEEDSSLKTLYLPICGESLSEVFFCLDIRKIPILSVSKSMKNMKFSSFYINLVNCNSNNLFNLNEINIKCFPTKEQLSAISGQVYLTTSSIMFDRENYNIPYDTFQVDYNYFLSNKTPFFLKSDYTLNFFNDDKGWVSSNYFNHYKLDMSTITIDKLGGAINDINFSIKFNIKDIFLKYTRRYSKFSNVLSEIGGLLKVLITICSLISNIITSFSYDMFFIANSFKLISFDDSHSSREDRNEYNHDNKIYVEDMKNKDFTTNNENFKTRPSSSSLKPVPITKSNIRGRFFFNYIFSQIKLFFGIFTVTSYKKPYISNKQNNMQTALEISHIKRGFDYFYQKIREFEIFQQMFLNEAQILALSCIEKPEIGNITTIGVDGVNKRTLRSDYNLLLDPDEKREIITDYFSDCLFRKTLTEFDVFIMNSLNSNIKSDINNKFSKNDLEFTSICMSNNNNSIIKDQGFNSCASANSEESICGDNNSNDIIINSNEKGNRKNTFSIGKFDLIKKDELSKADKRHYNTNS